MRDISFFVVPIRDHAFFEQAVLKGQLSQTLFQLSRFRTQGFNFRAIGLAGNIPREPLLTGFKEVIGPFIVKALGDTFLSADLGYTLFTAKTVQDNPNLLFGTVLLAGLTFNVAGVRSP